MPTKRRKIIVSGLQGNVSCLCRTLPGAEGPSLATGADTGTPKTAHTEGPKKKNFVSVMLSGLEKKNRKGRKICDCDWNEVKGLPEHKLRGGVVTAHAEGSLRARLISMLTPADSGSPSSLHRQTGALSTRLANSGQHGLSGLVRLLPGCT